MQTPRRRVEISLVVAALVTSPMWAQKNVAPEAPPSGTVYGHLTCSDTQRPARFATVALLRKPDAASKGKAEKDLPKKLIFLNTMSELDGSYVLREVPVGDYFLVAQMAGYVIPLAASASEEQAADLEKVLAENPSVHVVADHTIEVNLVLRHGATVTGRVAFDDGSPVVGAYVNVETADGSDPVNATHFMPLSQIVGGSRTARTNDQGEYRIAGMPPGKYLANVIVMSGGGMRLAGDDAGQSVHFNRASGFNNELKIYMPATFHKSQAKVIEIQRDEVVPDADIAVELNGLHTVRGRVIAKNDRHPVNYGYVQLLDASDKDFKRFASVHSDGSFVLDYVPAGTFNVQAQEAEDIELYDFSGNDPKTLRTFLDSKPVAIVVDDQDVMIDDFLLDEAKKPSGH